MIKDKRTWEEIIIQVFTKAKADKEYAARKINAEWVINFIKSKVLLDEQNKIRNQRTARTVIERIQVVAETFDIPSVSSDDKKAIGELVRDVFFKTAKNLYLRFEKIDEPEGTFAVNLYPSRFVPVMDAIILKYFKDKGLILAEADRKPELAEK